MHALMMLLLSAHTGIAAPARPVHVQQADGKAVFDANCRKCHGVKGTPAPSTKRMMPNIPTFDAGFLSKKSLKDVVQVVNKGKGDMKPLNDKLSAAQIDAVAQYIFQLANATPKGGK